VVIADCRLQIAEVRNRKLLEQPFSILQFRNYPMCNKKAVVIAEVRNRKLVEQPFSICNSAITRFAIKKAAVARSLEAGIF